MKFDGVLGDLQAIDWQVTVEGKTESVNVNK